MDWSNPSVCRRVLLTLFALVVDPQRSCSLLLFPSLKMYHDFIPISDRRFVRDESGENQSRVWLSVISRYPRSLILAELRKINPFSRAWT